MKRPTKDGYLPTIQETNIRVARDGRVVIEKEEHKICKKCNPNLEYTRIYHLNEKKQKE